MVELRSPSYHAVVLSFDGDDGATPLAGVVRPSEFIYYATTFSGPRGVRFAHKNYAMSSNVFKAFVAT